MKRRSRGNNLGLILQILINKYRVDPDGFRSYLPEVTQEIEKMVSSPIKKSHISTLTELERERLCELLLTIPMHKPISKAEAIKALAYCATLIQDESLPDEVDRKAVLNLIHNVIGTPVSKITKRTRITLGDGEETRTLAILRGIYLHLTWDDQVVAISISPSKQKERSEAMKFVGVAKDTDSNASQQHRVYFTEG